MSRYEGERIPMSHYEWERIFLYTHVSLSSLRRGKRYSCLITNGKGFSYSPTRLITKGKGYWGYHNTSSFLFHFAKKRIELIKRKRKRLDSRLDSFDIFSIQMFPSTFDLIRDVTNHYFRHPVKKYVWKQDGRYWIFFSICQTKNAHNVLIGDF